MPEIPLLACAPFVALLLCIAVLPLVAPRWWHSNARKALVAVPLGAIAGGWTLWALGPAPLLESMHHYVAFIVMLGALYVISGGILLEGDVRPTPMVNLGFLLAGSMLASFIGTTGASMLLIRPLLRINRGRTHVVHTVVFFIFLVSNIGGCLTPLGDPPLYVGYLQGVPFTWTLTLWPEWLFMVATMLTIYAVFELRAWRREPPLASAPAASPAGASPSGASPSGASAGAAPPRRAPLRVRGVLNVALLIAAVLTVALVREPQVPHAAWVRDGLLLGLALLSLRATPAAVHGANEFDWGPLVEVAVVFVGLFAAMTPALLLLEHNGGALGLTKPWHFFWATAGLSGVLDNAPAYLSFGSAAAGLMQASSPGVTLVGQGTGMLVNIDPLLHPELARLGHDLVVAISLGAVFAGASTYIGNGPNFMVKAIAKSRGVRMPSFAGYCAWSATILLPLLVLLTLLFLT